MDVLHNYSQTKFMEFVPEIKRNTDEWWIVDVALTGKTSHNSAYIALKLKEYFYGRAGVIFICNRKNVLVLAHVGKDVTGDSLSNGVHEKLPQHSCTAQTVQATSDGLVKIQLRLQAFEQDNKTRPDISALMAARQERKERVVMIVDDDAFMRALVSKTFRSRSKVIEFKDTHNVLDAYLEHLPDVVYLDIHLPGGSGITLLSEMVEFDPGAYVIILSSDSVKDNIMNAKELGAKGFIAKPFTLEKLESYYNKCPTVAITAYRK